MTTANIQIEDAVAIWLATGAPTPRPHEKPKKTGQPFSQPVKFWGGNAQHGRRFTLAGVNAMRARRRE
jgi:hypothetical protein